MGNFGYYLYLPSYAAQGLTEYGYFTSGLTAADSEIYLDYQHRIATTNVHGLTFSGEGAGGGLDADTVDGYHAAAFITTGGSAGDSARFEGYLPAAFLSSAGSARDSSMLQGKLPIAFLSSAGSARDSSLLQGYLPTAFIMTGGTVASATDSSMLQGRHYTAFASSAHASQHEGAGADPIPLDQLGAPTNNTSGNVTSSYHGLCPILPNITTAFFRGDGKFISPSLIGFTTSTSATCATSYTQVGPSVTLSAAGTYIFNFNAFVQNSAASYTGYFSFFCSGSGFSSINWDYNGVLGTWGAFANSTASSGLINSVSSSQVEQYLIGNGILAISGPVTLGFQAYTGNAAMYVLMRPSSTITVIQAA